jgi:6-phosphogluconolactonase
VALLGAALFSCAPAVEQTAAPEPQDDFLVYVGTYTGPVSRGIYAYRFSSAMGRLTALGLAAETTNPSFLAAHPSGNYLYAVNEVGEFEGRKTGAVSAFALDRGTGKLTLLNQVSSRGAGPCHLSLDRTGRYVLVANYGGGSVAALPILEDGRLGEASGFVQHKGKSVNPQRQEGPHGHGIEAAPDNRFVLAADLGLDQVLVYRFDAEKGTLAPNDPPYAKLAPGAGPRHFAFSPDGRFVYVLNELTSTMTVFSYDTERGALTEAETLSTLPGGFRGENYTAEVVAHPSGKFLYGSNRGHDSIVVFAADAATGTLKPVAHVSTQGKWPRNFAVDPTGACLIAANQRSDNLVVFRIASQTGRLTPTGQVVEVPSPACVTFVALD